VNTLCTNCGTTLAPNMKFCATCGTGAATPPTPESSVAITSHLSAASFAESANRQALPAPPSLHWAIVLLLTVVTLGGFALIWAFVQAIWVKRLTGTWKPLIWLSVPFSLIVFAFIRNPAATIPSAFGCLFLLGVFSVRRHVVQHYNSAEPIGLKIGFWQTFLGEMFYLQYHFSGIARLKREQPHLFAPHAKPIAVPHQRSSGLAADIQPGVSHQ
jgi:hypothetical protein